MCEGKVCQNEEADFRQADVSREMETERNMDAASLRQHEEHRLSQPVSVGLAEGLLRAVSLHTVPWPAPI